MKTPPNSSLWSALFDGQNVSNCLFAREATVPLRDLEHASALGGWAEELRGQSVLIATKDQLTTALALIELDGVARRVVLCPPGLGPQHLPAVKQAAEVDAAVVDGTGLDAESLGIRCVVACTPNLLQSTYDRSNPRQTEWVLLTSGTTGGPKLTAHTLTSLSGAIKHGSTASSSIVWSTFYDIRRYGGLQIFLRAVLTGASLVLSSAEETAADFLRRAGRQSVTHISGTPSHWRSALMSASAKKIDPRYVRLSGEIADQAILDELRASYPQAKIVHAFASTEAGVAFEVTDGLAGFPASAIDSTSDVEMRVEDGSLRIRSSRVSTGYLGCQAPHLKGEDGFVDTGDMLELRGHRYYFVGRRDGVVNVGGLKVHPEEVEAVINGHPRVRMSFVRTRKNPITGALVVADVVLNASETVQEKTTELHQDILSYCRRELPAHKVPAVLNFVPALTVSETGKLMRSHA
jgi:acyl-coenzyme A synthetase/AMP-(fatty) acid ligase